MARKGLNIYHRKDGRWEGRYKSGYTADGQTKYSSVYGKSYSAVRDILIEKKSEKESNTMSVCKLTVGEIINKWLKDVIIRVKESTYANYQMKLNKHILPHFSGMRYDCLTVEKLNYFIVTKISSGLSEKYVSDIVVLLKSIANYASKHLEFINRIGSVSMPKSYNLPETRLYSVSEQSKLMDYITNNPSCSNVGVLLTLTTGLRIGELCSLKWEDIDLEKSTLTVRHTVQRISNGSGKGTKLIVSSPKSSKSLREIPLPDFIIPLLKEIKADSDCFVLSGNSKIVEPRTMQYRFKSLLKKVGLPYVNFHSLRHIFASNCVALGCDVKTLSEILGHSSVSVTLSRYVHSSMERKKNCMKLLSNSIGAA